MEESLARAEEGLPAVELEEESKPNRLREARDRLAVEAAAPPEVPPPITLEQLVSAEAVVAERKQLAKERKQARKQLKEVYKETEQLETKAEKSDEPLEIDYEKRAEIKAEPAPTAEEQGLAKSISQIIADIQAKTAAAHKAFTKSVPKAPKLSVKLPKIIQDLPAMYKQAVAAGFGLGVIVFVIVLVVAS